MLGLPRLARLPNKNPPTFMALNFSSIASTILGLFGRVASLLVLCNLAFEAIAAPYQAPGTKRMAERLQKITEQSNPRNNLYMNRERADLFGQELKQLLATPDSPDKGAKVLDLDSRYATELLLCGKSWEAIQEFTMLDAFIKTSPVQFGTQTRSSLRHYLAIAYLRLGEQENCLSNHTIDSCLMPIQAAGIHKIQRGSRKAVEFLIEQLNEFPDDLKARWLLNLAYMTLGEYPDKVPSKWLIPPKVFQSDYPLPRFYDVAGNLGLDLNSLSGGVIVEDFDGDGNLDIMISSLGVRDQLRYFRNNGDGTFTDRTEEAGLIGETGGLNILQTDYNNDGWPDVLVLRGAWFGVEGHYPLSLLRNNGNGTFDDVTEEAGLLRICWKRNDTRRHQPLRTLPQQRRRHFYRVRGGGRFGRDRIHQSGCQWRLQQRRLAGHLCLKPRSAQDVVSQRRSAEREQVSERRLEIH
ncbi:MAG: hypothetical protein DME19_16920 [Verrucomicrobia bacterium]|nr:MAG: hypothetical protein DME19_16920 [Verrucomicrobiota bacterium]